MNIIKHIGTAMIVALSALPASYSVAQTGELPKEIFLGATEWCPYSCGDVDTTLNPPHKPGIVTEYLRYILAKYGVAVNVEILPWSRAVSEAEGGLLDGLLTAVHEEVETLSLTDVPTMSYQSCFYVLNTNRWQYQGTDSLAGMHLGAIAGYGYGQEIDPYLEEHAQREDIVTQISGQNGKERLPMMLYGHRIDAYLADRHVEAWRLTSSGSQADIHSAGCIAEEPFYVAFNPQKKWTKDIIGLLNQEFSDPENQAHLKEIIRRYM